MCGVKVALVIGGDAYKGTAYFSDFDFKEELRMSLASNEIKSNELVNQDYAGIFEQNTNIKVFTQEKRKKALQKSDILLERPRRANKSDLSSVSRSGDTAEQHLKNNFGVY